MDIFSAKLLYLGGAVACASGVFKIYAQVRQNSRLQKIAEFIKKVVTLRFAVIGVLYGGYLGYNLGVVFCVLYAFAGGLGSYAFAKAGTLVGEEITKIAANIFVFKRSLIRHFS